MSGSAWSHCNPVAIRSADGLLAQAGMIAGELGFGDHWLLVTSAGFTRRGVAADVRRNFALAGLKLRSCDTITPNPELDLLDDLAVDLRQAPINGILAIGGGSVIDAAKALSVAVPSANPRPLDAALRSSSGQRWAKRIPVVALPTTSGTGAEVTPFATVWDSANQRKHSVTGDCLFPHMALLDPLPCVSLPINDTLYTALDAISHALESLWNRHRNPISEAMAIAALHLSVAALPRVQTDPANVGVRRDLQHASMLAGLAISQTRTALAHSISYPLTLRYGVPHGLACSFTLPALLRIHLDASEPHAGERSLLVEVSRLLDSIDFPAHLARFVDADGILALQSQMTTPGRADNLIHRVDLQAVLRASLPT